MAIPNTPPDSQPSPLGADSDNPLAEDIDTSFDNATQTPPARGWSDSQQATLDEICLLYTSDAADE